MRIGSGTRTHTFGILSSVPLPLGYPYMYERLYMICGRRGSRTLKAVTLVAFQEQCSRQSACPSWIVLWRLSHFFRADASLAINHIARAEDRVLETQSVKITLLSREVRYLTCLSSIMRSYGELNPDHLLDRETCSHYNIAPYTAPRQDTPRFALGFEPRLFVCKSRLKR